MSDERSKITFTEASSGPLIAPLYGNCSLETHLRLGLAALKAEAEQEVVRFRAQKQGQ